MLINHCHVSSKGFGEEKDKPEMGTIPALVRILDDLDVDGAVLFAPFGGAWDSPGENLDPNEWLCRELSNYPSLRGFATVFPQDHDAPAQLRRAISMGLVGAKVHPAVMRIRLDDPSLDDYWQAAEELHIPVSIHTGTHAWNLRYYMPLLIDDIARRHPDLPIILEHIGGIAFFDQALAVLHNNSSCYAGLTQNSGRDPTYVLSSEQIQILLDSVGAGRIIYGFDYPWPTDNHSALKNDLEWIQSWDIAEEDKQKILGGNLTRLVARS